MLEKNEFAQGILRGPGSQEEPSPGTRGSEVTEPSPRQKKNLRYGNRRGWCGTSQTVALLKGKKGTTFWLRAPGATG